MTTPVLESRFEEGLSVFKTSRSLLIDDLRIPRFGSNSIKIKRSLVLYGDEH